MKKSLSLFCILAVASLYAQDLRKHIPRDVDFVFEVNSSNLTDKLSISELDESVLGEMFLSELSGQLGREFTSVNDLGLNLDASQYFFGTFMDDSFVMVYLLPLKSASTLEDLLNSENEEFIQFDGYKSVAIDGDGALNWNNSMLSLVMVEDNRYGTQQENDLALNGYLKPTNASILQNSEYANQYDEAAIGSIWLNNTGNVLQQLANISGGMAETAGNLHAEAVKNFYGGYNSFTVKFYSDESESKIVSELSLSDKLATMHKAWANRKFNKEFLNYLNIENCLGYIAIKMNTQAYLETYPGFISENISSITDDKYTKAADAGISMFSLLLDEAAVGELIGGDLIFVLNNLVEREVEYLDYAYDEDYNYTETLKTKTEKLPDFLLMASSKEGDFTQKAIAFLEDEKMVEKSNGIYKINDGKELPLDFYFLYKNDILFLGTSEADMMAIRNGTFLAKIPAEHKKSLKSNQMVFYSDLKKLKTVLKEDDLGTTYYKTFSEVITDTPEFFATSTVSGNKLTGEFVMVTPEGHTNGLTYLLSVIEKVIQMK